MKRKLIIADPDIDYAIKLLEQFSLKYLDLLDIHVITDADYFYDYFSRRQEVDILIVAEDFNSVNLRYQQIDKVFWLSENQNVEISSDPAVEYLYKYSSPGSLMSRMSKGLGNARDGSDGQCRLIVVTSANGGTGKTTIATVLAAMQQMIQRKVLYFNVANIQNFSHLLKDPQEIPLASDRKLADQISFSPYSTLSRYFRKDGFDYLPAFNCALSDSELPLSIFEDFVDKARNSADYDVLVADVSNGSPDLQREFLQRADHAVIVADESRAGLNALNKLMPSLTSRKDLEVSVLLNKVSRKGDFMTLNLSDTQHGSRFNFSIDKDDAVETMTSADLAAYPAFNKVINLCY